MALFVAGWRLPKGGLEFQAASGLVGQRGSPVACSAIRIRDGCIRNETDASRSFRLLLTKIRLLVDEMPISFSKTAFS